MILSDSKEHVTSKPVFALRPTGKLKAWAHLTAGSQFTDRRRPFREIFARYLTR